MEKIFDIVIAKETVSDDFYTVVIVLFADGSFVRKGDVTGSVETSKAIIDIESPQDGFIYYKVKPGDKISAGDVFAVISADKEIPQEQFKKKEKIKSKESPSQSFPNKETIRISKLAASLMTEYNIDISVFKNKNLITKNDIENYLKGIDREHDKPFFIPEAAEEAKASRIIIVGGGNHTRACIDIVKQMGIFEIAGIVYTKYSPGTSLMDIPVLGDLDSLKVIFEKSAHLAVVGIGGLEMPEERVAIFEMLKKIGFKVPNIIHPRSIIEPSVVIGEGNQVMGGANIGACANIGTNCIINSNAVVSHDCVIEDNVHIAPGAILGGTVRVGKNSLIGMGSTLYYNVKVGKNVVIRNGLNIFKDISDGLFVKEEF
jgi:sugar O-acyltransferase (sialic acid O-acetyltransferase NeuD family)